MDMTTPQGIVCLHDLLRGVNSFPIAFFDLVREPIHQGTGFVVSYPPGGKRPHGLAPEFDLVKFRTRAGMPAHIFIDNAARQTQWSTSYHHLPDSAIDYLFDHLPAGHMLLSFDLPPWLVQACVAQGLDFLDIRPSPLRFGRDLYMALRSNRPEILQRISAHTVLEEELRLEAAVLRANVRLHKERLQSERGFVFEDLEDSLLFVGQVPWDASLLAPDGNSLRASDFSDQLRELSRGRRLFHKSHPFAPDFGQQERTALRRITGQHPLPCQQNAYQILSSEEDIALVGIASGLLQEASWFDKMGTVLYKPFVPLTESETPNEETYQQVHFHTLLSPAFWHQVLRPERPAPRLAALPHLAHNHARETIDQWWDYSKAMIWERSFPVESFERSGGGLLRQRIETLERSFAQLSTAQDGNHTETPQPVGFAPDTQRWQNMDARHLKELTDPQEAAALFKHSVRMVEIEVSSYCNRKCWFCPNATYDRMSDNKLMSAEMYSSILRQLASIGYDGTITYSRYNEPLADKMILERIAEARRMLPDAQLHTNTNGDYLDLEYVEQLYAVGLRSLNIQIYLGNKERYDHAKIKAAGDKTLKRVQLPHTLVRDTPGEWYEQRLHYRDMSIRLYGRNFETGGTSRGGEVPIHMDYQRTSPCLIPFWAVYIDHDGSTVPCCNFRSDIPAHADYVIGKLTQKPDLFLQYASRFAANFRASLIKDGVKEGLCSNCHYAEEQPSQEQTAQLACLLAGKGR